MASIQTSEIDIKGLIDKIKRFVDLFIELRQSLETLTKIAHSLADELDDHHRNVSIAKVTGAAAGIVGGTIAAAGFVLSFFTFGAASPLMIAGGVVAGAGSGTIGGATITRMVLSQQTKKKFEKHLKEHSKIQQKILERCRYVSEVMEKIGDMDTLFPQWVQFWGRLVCETDYNATDVVWNVVMRCVVSSLGIANGTSRVITGAAKTVVRTLCAVGRGIHIAGGVAGILFIPVDIYTLVDSAIDIHKKSPNDVATQLRDTVDEVAIACPTIEQVRAMIDVVTRVLSYMKCG